MTVKAGARADAPVAPRLLNLQQAGEYLGCSYWSVRDWVLAGWIPVVDLPPLLPRSAMTIKIERFLTDRVPALDPKRGRRPS